MALLSVVRPFQVLVAVSCVVWTSLALAQAPGQPDKANSAPLQLLAPLPSPVPTQMGPTLPQAAKPAAKPVAAPAKPSVVAAPVAAAAATPAFELPVVAPPEPVTSDLFVKQPVPVIEPKPAASVIAVVPAAPQVKSLLETPADSKPAAATPEKLTVIVAGDSIADGVWGGLYRKLLGDKRYEIVRKARNSSGFVAFDWVEELRGTEEFKRADAVIFLAGTNDRQSLVRQGKPRFLFGTREWEEGYIERVTALMQTLKQHNIPLVWISLPIARKDEFNKDSRYLNGLFTQAAAKVGVHYIDIWAMFADKDGQYSAYLPDSEGRNRLLRDNDGIHFTPRGYEMIADAVLQTLQKRVPAFQQASMSEPPKTGKQN